MASAVVNDPSFLISAWSAAKKTRSGPSAASMPGAFQNSELVVGSGVHDHEPFQIRERRSTDCCPDRCSSPVMPESSTPSIFPLRAWS